MQSFAVNWLRWLYVMSFVGIGFVVLIVLGFYWPSLPHRPLQEVEPEEYAAGISVTNRGVPLILVLLYIGVFLYIITYVIYVWRAGVRH